MIYFNRDRARSKNISLNILDYLHRLPLGVIFIPNASFSTTPSNQRAYARWVALATKAGFSAKEVLDANTMGEFVVVDPMNKSALLALSGPAYQKLLGQVLARDDQSVILLLSPLDEKTPSTSDASGDDSQNSPNVPGFVTTLADLSNAVKSKRYVYKWQVYSQRQAFTAYAGIGATVTGSGLLFSSAEHLLAVVQRWSTRLIFWGGLAWRRQARSELFVFLRSCKKILDNSGPYGLCLYLKGCYNIVLHFLSGNPLTYAFTSCKVPIKITNGLPRILPRGWRQSIRCRSTSKIRYILSILYIYKGMKVTPSKAINAYEGMMLPPSNISLEGFKPFVESFLRPHKMPLNTLRPLAFLPSIRASPTSALGAAGIGADCYAWMQRAVGGPFEVPVERHPFTWLKLVGDNKVDAWIRLWSDQFVKGTFDTEYVISSGARPSKAYGLWKYLHNLGVAHQDPKVVKSWASGSTLSFSPIFSGAAKQLEAEGIALPVGRSHILHEAGGKKRLIAIMDAVRQACFKPLHDALLDLIQEIFGPMSAIRSQAETVRSFAQRKNKYVYSFDISKATDTISKQLYRPILSTLFSEELALCWEGLMTSYPFITEGDDCSRLGKIKGGTYRFYGRGQPMGGYSSFAALELLHHLLVQYSAFSSGLRVTSSAPFDNYCVLGDDVVIGDPNVAQAYLDTCSYYEIPISAGKSYQSNTGFFSFVSEIFIKDVCLSPLSLRADLLANNIATRFEYATKAMERGYGSFAPSKLFNSIFRLMLHKNQFKAEIERMERGSVSTLSHRVLGALSIICNGAQGLSISYWLRKAVSPLGVSELRGDRVEISIKEMNWMVAVLRQLIFNRTKSLAHLQRAEAAAVTRWLTYFQGHLYRIMEANERLKFVLGCQCSCPEWINYAFIAYAETLDITPEITAAPKGDGPFAHLLFKKTLEERQLSS